MIDASITTGWIPGRAPLEVRQDRQPALSLFQPALDVLEEYKDRQARGDKRRSHAAGFLLFGVLRRRSPQSLSPGKSPGQAGGQSTCACAALDWPPACPRTTVQGAGKCRQGTRVPDTTPGRWYKRPAPSVFDFASRRR